MPSFPEVEEWADPDVVNAAKFQSKSSEDDDEFEDVWSKETRHVLQKRSVSHDDNTLTALLGDLGEDDSEQNDIQSREQNDIQSTPTTAQQNDTPDKVKRKRSLRDVVNYFLKSINQRSATSHNIFFGRNNLMLKS